MRAGWAAVGVAALACASGGRDNAADLPTAPLPSVTLAGQSVTLYPLTMLVPEVALGWDEVLGEPATALAKADSLIEASLTSRAPEVDWLPPEALRRAARRAPGMLPDPDRMGTAVLRGGFQRLPDPLRSQMRLLTGTAGDRLALVPASLLFFKEESGDGRAELTVVLADVRTGTIPWRTVAKGSGEDPWTALRLALEALAPIAQ